MFKDLPVALIGGKGRGIKGGRHVRYPQDTPITNFYLSLLDNLGVPVESLGDSTGRVEL
jgi:hypothetical protein